MLLTFDACLTFDAYVVASGFKNLHFFHFIFFSFVSQVTRSPSLSSSHPQFLSAKKETRSFFLSFFPFLSFFRSFFSHFPPPFFLPLFIYISILLSLKCPIYSMLDREKMF